MGLLWDGLPAPKRGPQQRLDLATIVDTAIAAGSAELSMRELAKALGIGAASLYTYVPGRAELLELMVDRVVGAQPLPTAADGWRAGLRGMASSDLAAFRAHPWLLQVGTSRAVLGPHVVARYDASLAVLDGLDLPAIDVVRTISALGSYVRGAAAAVVDAEQAPQHTATTDDEWWAARAPELDRRLADAFPRLTRIDAEGGFAVSDTELPYPLQQALDAFDFGLDLLLDAIAARLRA